MNNPYLETQAINWLTEQCSIESTLIPPRFLGDGKEVNNPTWHGYNIESSNKKLRDKYGYAFDWHNENFLTVTFKTFIGDFKIKEDFRSNEPVKKLTKAEVKAAKDAAEQAREITKANDAKIAQRALEGIIKDFFDHFTADPQPHPYLEKKSVAWGERFRCHSDKIYIPIFHSMPVGDGKNELISYQSIDGYGKKLFPKGGRTAGGFYPIGIDVAITPPILYIAEGYATAHTIHVATSSPVIVAFSASNILPVSTKLRELYPHTPLVIAGDDDRWKKSNAGRTVSTKVLSTVSNTHACFPSFDGLNVASLPTDFNDLFTIIKTQFDTQTAFEEVANQLEVVTNSIPKLPTIAQYATRYLPSIPFEKYDTVILHSGMGTGKTHGLPAWVRENIDDDENFIAIPPRITLVDSLIGKFSREGVTLSDYRVATLNENTYSISKLAACCNSISRLVGLLMPGVAEKTTVLIDEAEQVVRQLSTMVGLEESYRILKLILRRAKRVIVADANVDLITSLLKETRGDRSMLIVENSYQPGVGRDVTYWLKFATLFEVIINMLRSGGRALVATDSKEVTLKLEAVAKTVCSGKILVINSDSNHGKEELAFMNNPNAVINDYQLVVYSPAIASGVSIDEEGFKPFDLYCGFFSSLSGPNPEDAWQQMGRVRAPVNWNVFIDGRIEHEETDPVKILENQDFKVFREIGGLSPAEVTGLDERVKGEIRTLLKDVLYSDYARLQAAVVAKEARLKNNFRHTHKELAIRQGYAVKENSFDSDVASECVATAKALAARDFADRICNAEVLTEKEFNKIDGKLNKTPDEIYSAERHELEKFYAQSASTDLVTLDNKGEFRGVIKRLERLGNHGEAVTDAGNELVSLVKSKSPLHFKNHLLFIEVYQMVLGFAGYSIVGDEVTHDGRVLTAATISEFVRWVIDHKKEVRIFHKIPTNFKARPMEFLQTLLTDLGLQLMAKITKTHGERVRQYSADSSRIEKVNFWLRKRAGSRMDRG